MPKGKNELVIIGKRNLELTNLNKIFWPDEGYTKGDLINYYQEVADYILPYLKDRPLSLKRNPNGIRDNGFFHKNAGDESPDWVKTCDLFSEASDRIVHYLVCNDVATLVYVANLGSIELNPWNSTSRKLENPTYFIMDLDPSEKNTFDEIVITANEVKKLCDEMGATCYCKTSGSSGLHVFVPLAARYDYDRVKAFGKKFAQVLNNRLPEITSMERSLKKRGLKIYLDYLQNRQGQTIASVYSVRPKPGATVSVPLEWSEVKEGLDMNRFTIKTVLGRLKEKGDLFGKVLTEKNNLEKCEKLIDRILSAKK
jgi:bifunctional non-homologous end joining protein LigD